MGAAAAAGELVVLADGVASVGKSVGDPIDELDGSEVGTGEGAIVGSCCVAYALGELEG